MKALSFHESTKKCTENNKPKRKGKLHPAYHTERNSKGISLYESIKDVGQHRNIIVICKDDSFVEMVVDMALRLIVGVDIYSGTVEGGLQELSLKPPDWEDLEEKTKEELRDISSRFPNLLVKKATNTTAKFRDVKDEDIKKAAFLVVLKAAHNEAKRLEMTSDDVEHLVEQLFETENDAFAAAYQQVVIADDSEPTEEEHQSTREEAELPGYQELLEELFEAVESAVRVDNDETVDPQVQAAGNHDHYLLKTAAMDALTRFCTEDNFLEDQVSCLVGNIFNFTSRRYN